MRILIKHIQDNIEVYKILFPFFSAFILGFFGLIISSIHNRKQLKIAEKQNENNLELAIIKEVSNLLPKLGSGDANERKFAAITLGFYDKKSIPLLKILLFDTNAEIQIAAAEALIRLDNQEADEFLKDAILNKKVPIDPNIRSKILWISTRIGKFDIVSVSEVILDDVNENITVRQTAARSLGYNRDSHSINILMRNLQRSFLFFNNVKMPTGTGIIEANRFCEMIANQVNLIYEIFKAITAIQPSCEFNDLNPNSDALVFFLPKYSRSCVSDYSTKALYLKLIGGFNKKNAREALTDIVISQEKSDKLRDSAKEVIEIIDRNQAVFSHYEI